jgi:5,10-methenyltetrahydromethanopterin hydrogenase
MKAKFILYSTEGCHLCNIAKEVLINVGLDANEDIHIVDIIEDEELLNTYKESIPVVMNTKTNERLFWPFNAENVKEIL